MLVGQLFVVLLISPSVCQFDSQLAKGSQRIPKDPKESQRILKGLKESQRVSKDPKDSQRILKGSKVSQRVPKGPKDPKESQIVSNCLKWSPMVSNDLKGFQMFSNDLKWSQMFSNVPKWSQMVLNGKNSSKSFWRSQKAQYGINEHCRTLLVL